MDVGPSGHSSETWLDRASLGEVRTAGGRSAAASLSVCLSVGQSLSSLGMSNGGRHFAARETLGPAQVTPIGSLWALTEAQGDGFGIFCLESEIIFG